MRWSRPHARCTRPVFAMPPCASPCSPPVSTTAIPRARSRPTCWW